MLVLTELATRRYLTRIEALYNVGDVVLHQVRVGLEDAVAVLALPAAPALGIGAVAVLGFGAADSAVIAEG